MPRIIEAEGKRYEFPDDATDAEISAVLNAAPAGARQGRSGRSWIDLAVQALPAIGGTAGGLLGAAAGIPTLGLGSVPGAMVGASLLGAGGEAAKQLIARVRGLPGPATPQEAARDIAGQGAFQGGAQAVGAGVGAVAAPLATRLMQGALKPGVRTLLRGNPGEVPGVVGTLLNEGVNVTRAGVERLNTLISATNDEIRSAIHAVPASINPYRVASRLTPTAERFAEQVNPASDLKAVARAGQEFLKTHGQAMIPVQTAQRLKVGTYRQLAGKYGELKAADVEAQKALARGLKEEIATEVGRMGTDLGALNAREGALLEARDVTARRVALSANRDPLGLASLAVSHPMTFLTVLADRSPAVKSLLARGLWRSAGAAAHVSPALIRSAAMVVATSPDEP